MFHMGTSAWSREWAQQCHRQALALAPWGVPASGPNPNNIILRRREGMFGKNMSFGVGGSTTSVGKAPVQILALRTRCAFYLHGKLLFLPPGTGVA